MIQLKKILIAASSAIALSVFCAAGCYAAEVHLVEGTTAANLTTVLSGAQGGDTIKLTQNIENVEETITVDKDLTLDLNGCTLSGSVAVDNIGMINVTGENAKLTIEDSAANTGGASGEISNIVSNTGRVNVSAISVTSSGILQIESGTVSMKNETGKSSYSARAVYASAGTTVNILGGSLRAESNDSQTMAVYAKGTKSSLVSFNVTGGTFKATSTNNLAKGLYCNYTNTDISNAYIQVEANNKEAANGAAIAVYCETTNSIRIVNTTLNSTSQKSVACGVYATSKCTLDNPTITLSGDKEMIPVSSWSGKIAINNGNYNVSDSSKVSFKAVNISGGTFNFPVPASFCAEGKVPKTINENSYTVENLDVEDAPVVVTYNNSDHAFADLISALSNYNQENYNITLKNNLTLEEAVNCTKAKLIIDPNVTLTCPNLTVNHGENNGTITASKPVSVSDFVNNGIININYTDSPATLSGTNNGGINAAGGATLTNFINSENAALTVADGKKLTVNTGVVNDGTITGGVGSYMDVKEAITSSQNKGYAADGYRWDTDKWTPGGAAKIIHNDTEKYYDTFEDAKLAAADGDTIRLCEDTTLKKAISITNNLTLDLNGKALTIMEQFITIGNGKESGKGTLTITDGTATNPPTIDENGTVVYNSGKIVAPNNANVPCLILVKNYGHLILDSGKIEDSRAQSAQMAILVRNTTKDSSSSAEAVVEVNGGVIQSNSYGIGLIGTTQTNKQTSTNKPSSVTVTDGIIRTGYAALAGNGNWHNTEMNVKGGTLYSDDGAIYHPQDGTLNISDGTITGTTGLEVRAGNVTINGGTITATGDFSEEVNGNGSTITGAAVAVSQHGTEKPINVVISDQAKLKGAKALYENDTLDTPKDIQITFIGGTAEGEVYSENCTEFISGGTFTEDVSQYIAPNCAKKIEEGSKYTVVSCDNAAPIGTYVTVGDGNTYSQMTVVQRTFSADDSKSIKFKVEKKSGDATTETTAEGTIVNAETITGPACFAFIVNDIPKDDTVTITEVQ